MEPTSKNSEKQRNRSNKGQMNFLIAFMVRNKAFAMGKVLDVTAYNEQWKQLASDLNSIAGQNRSVQSWQRTWKDQIRMAKERKTDYLNFKRTQPLTDQDKKVLLAIGETLPIRSSNLLKRPANMMMEPNDDQYDPYGPSTSTKRSFSTHAGPFAEIGDENNLNISNIIKKPAVKLEEFMEEDSRHSYLSSPIEKQVQRSGNLKIKEESFGNKSTYVPRSSKNLDSDPEDITILSDDDEQISLPRNKKRNVDPLVKNADSQLNVSVEQKQIIELCAKMLVEACNNIQHEIQKGFENLNDNMNVLINQIVTFFLNQQQKQTEKESNEENDSLASEGVNTEYLDYDLLDSYTEEKNEN